MGSRHLQGSVFARVRALLTSGTLKKKPVWYDVMEAFPPLMQTKLTDIPIDGRPPVITYKEDEVRELFYKRFPLLRKISINLVENSIQDPASLALKGRSGLEAKIAHLPTIETVICKYKEITRTTHDHQAAIDRTIDWLLNEEQTAKLKLSWAKEIEVSRQKNQEVIANAELPDDIDIAELFKLKRTKDN